MVLAAIPACERNCPARTRTATYTATRRKPLPAGISVDTDCPQKFSLEIQGFRRAIGTHFFTVLPSPAMEGLGAAANVIAVVDLCAKVASFCYQYSLAVKDAKNDITRLQGEVKSLRDVLGEVQQLLNGPDSAKLSASQKLLEALKDGFSQLKTLDERLNPGKARKAMSRMGVRALKWPFESKEVDKVINGLEKCKQTVSLALQIDQT
jgi:hypothetical protein